MTRMAHEHRSHGGDAPAALEFVVLCDSAAVREQAAAWAELGVSYVDAELDYFLASAETRDDVDRPHVVVAFRDRMPVGLVVGRIERTRLSARLGYMTVLRPKVRRLRVVHGGISAVDDEIAVATVLHALSSAFAAGAHVASLPALRTDSPVRGALLDRIGAVRRGHFVAPRPHHRLILPGSFDELLASHGRRSRYNLKRSISLLDKEFGERLHVEVLSRPEHYERALEDLERIASLTYQRGLGAGFAHTPERRALTRIALDRGWFRAWVLRIDDRPVAFWQGNVLGGVYFSSSTGYDPEFAKQGVGTYVQVRMFRDLIDDPEVSILDFGWGDAAYKSRFGNEQWEEQDVLVFAPTPRGIGLGATSTAIAAADHAARWAARRTGVTERVKRSWRSRLRRRTEPVDTEASG
jgi:hypothetical protein